MAEWWEKAPKAEPEQGQANWWESAPMADGEVVAAQEPVVADEQPSTGQSLMIGMGRGFTDAAEGVQQTAMTQAKDINEGIRDLADDRGYFDQVGDALKTVASMNLPSMIAFGMGKGNDKSVREFTDKANKEREFYEQTPVGKSVSGKVGRVAGNALPYTVVPGGAAGSLPVRMATGGVAGAGIGATNFQSDPEASRVQDAAVGAAFGAGAPLVGAGIKEGIIKPAQKAITYVFDKVKPMFGRTSKALAEDLAGSGIEDQARKALKASQRLGDDFLTPAEASGRSRLASKQGKLGITEDAANLIEDRFRTRADSQKKIIHAFLTDLAPDNKSAAGAARKAAQGVLDDMSMLRARAAKPFYQEAFGKAVPEDKIQTLLSDPVISRAFDKVGNDPVWQKVLQDTPTNSVEYLHTVKESIDDVASYLIKSGENKAARAVLDSKSALVKTIEDVAPEYKTANQVYSSFSRAIDDLKDSPIGKVADLDNTQLKRVSQIIFDPKETDSVARAKFNAMLQKKDPEAWGRLVRNEIERRLDMSKKDVMGSTFYDAILAKPKDFRVFLDATRGNPVARQKLLDMRRAWGNLINAKTVRSAEGQAKSSLEAPRNALDAAKNYLSELLGGKYDKAAAEFVTSSKWDQQYKQVMKIKDPKRKTEELAALLGKIAASQQGDE